MAPREADVLRPGAHGKTKGIPIIEEHISLCKHHSKAKINFSERTGEKGFNLEHCRKAKVMYLNEAQQSCKKRKGRGNMPL